MLIKHTSDIRSSEITDKKLYLNRRELLQGAAATAVGLLGGTALLDAATPAPHGHKLENVKKGSFSADEKPNKWEEITTYNNFYEFGTSYDSASTYARSLKPEPWTITVE